MRRLTEEETKKILERYGIPTPKSILTKIEDQAVFFSKKIGFPVVLKIDSEDIIHKTEAKAVITNVRSEEEVSKSYKKILENTKAYNPKAKINGVVVQEYVQGYETIVGGKVDEQFGPIVLFGAGGIFTELLKDVAIRICPIEREDAEEMVNEIKFSKVLRGFRGNPPVNTKAIVDILLKVSKIMIKENIREMDINPLMVSPEGAKAVDVRIIKE
jgi:acyl-CoA synthetase (NDP forming)